MTTDTSDPAGQAASMSDGAVDVLQPGAGPRWGGYLPAGPATVLWGRLPNRDTPAVLEVDSGSVVTVDTVSHEGVLEDQGRDPLGYFAGFGVPAGQVLADAVEIAARVTHDGPGPHVLTGPIAVRGTEPGGVLRIDVLDLRLRVPYGVVSNRHGKGALPGELPERWAGDAALRRYFNTGGNVSVFAPVRRHGGRLVGVIGGGREARFPLAPFLGVMGVASDTSDVRSSVPPTSSGGNLDVNDLGVGSTLYLPVRVPGAMFFTGDPHMAQGDGEVALTAMEGSLRATLRLTAIAPGGDAPGPAFRSAFGETGEFWIPIGLSDPDGLGGAGGVDRTSLDLAMRDAVRHAMDFLTGDLGMDGPAAYAYLSAATDFHVSQVVDVTTGIHALIRKTHFT